MTELPSHLWPIAQVARETIAANVYTYSEAHWNARIHAPLQPCSRPAAGIEVDANQDGAIQRDVRYMDATKASISSSYMPRHTDGDSLAVAPAEEEAEEEAPVAPAEEEAPVAPAEEEAPVAPAEEEAEEEALVAPAEEEAPVAPAEEEAPVAPAEEET
ncbi:hypothetical protein CTA1_11870 [Colletotrichum tanaceti]|uniref:Uncharacterized protein n=1 Tax=Colletotrichum tanaceti TaxID=1306861 RepID=A0A4V6DJ14_9PEZI|nr:hypothetical protein CTA1_11870 [Colletotrichum tanaceti]